MLKRKHDEMKAARRSIAKRTRGERLFVVADSSLSEPHRKGVEKINAYLASFYDDIEELRIIKTVASVKLGPGCFLIPTTTLDLGNVDAGVRLAGGLLDEDLVPVWRLWSEIKSRSEEHRGPLIEVIAEQIATLTGTVGLALELAQQASELMTKYFGEDWHTRSNFYDNRATLSLPLFEIPATVFARGASHLVRHLRQFLAVVHCSLIDMERDADSLTLYYKKAASLLDTQIPDKIFN